MVSNTDNPRQVKIGVSDITLVNALATKEIQRRADDSNLYYFIYPIHHILIRYRPEDHLDLFLCINITHLQDVDTEREQARECGHRNSTAASSVCDGRWRAGWRGAGGCAGGVGSAGRVGNAAGTCSASGVRSSSGVGGASSSRGAVTDGVWARRVSCTRTISIQTGEIQGHTYAGVLVTVWVRVHGQLLIVRVVASVTVYVLEP